MFTDLRRDVRYALRTMTREPGFTAAVVVTLALGIGATTTVFSRIDAVLLRHPAIAQPDRVVSVHSVWAARATANPGRGDQLGTSSYPDYVDLRDSAVLQGLAAFATIGLALETNGVTERIDAEIVSGNYFDVLGVRAAVGRTFGSDDDRIGFPARVVVLSHRIWRQRFGGDRNIVGRSISLNGSAYTVVGVAPREFAGVELGAVPEAWVPMAMQEEVRPASAALRQRLGSARLDGARDVRWLSLVARLKNEATLAASAAALDTIGRRLAVAFSATNRDITATAVPLGEGSGVRTRARPVLVLLTAAVVLVLAIACANVASLLLARALSRRREVAVRIAIGAGHGQLVRQWLTEAVILGLLGAAGGVLLAGWGAPVLHGFGLPESVDLATNRRIVAFALAVGVGTGLVVGLATFLQSTRGAMVNALRGAGGLASVGPRAGRLRSVFVVLQVAMSLVLLVGAGLLVRTVQKAYAVELGYDVERVLVADVTTGDGVAPDAGQVLYDRLLERLNGLPGVASASAARITVLSGSARTVPLSLDGQPPRADRSNLIPVRVNVITERYLETMGISLLRGRAFQRSDGPGSPRVAIVSRSLADRLWPNADPIGRSFLSTSRLEVVGVVPDVVYLNATERDPRPVFYLPLTQNYESSVALHLRVADDPLAIVAGLRQAVRDVDVRLSLTRARTLVEELDRSMTSRRTIALLVGVLSAGALLLSTVGLYGAMAYSTRQRTSEVGLRLALGATPGSVMNLIVFAGLRLVSMGVAIGLAAAFFGARYLRSQLFGIEPTDPATWIVVTAMLATVALIACVIPARRAMHIDPAVTLKSS
jgi:putative ABC transport system permease protein